MLIGHFDLGNAVGLERDGSILWTPQTTRRSLKPAGATPSQSNATRRRLGPNVAAPQTLGKLATISGGDSPMSGRSFASSAASPSPLAASRFGKPQTKRPHTPTSSSPGSPAPRKPSLRNVQDIQNLLQGGGTPSPPLRRARTFQQQNAPDRAGGDAAAKPARKPRVSKSNTAMGITEEYGTPTRRGRMYWKAGASELTRANSSLERAGDADGVSEVPARIFTLISSALVDMFFLGTAMFAKMHSVVAAFEREEFAVGADVMVEGDAGDKMYVIESGAVIIHRSRELHDTQRSRPNTPSDGDAGGAGSVGDRVRLGACGVGEIVGELALLYGETRSSTATVDEGPCVCWSLTRDRFRALAAVADARSLSQRAVNLRLIPTLALLSRRQIYLLARAMKSRKLGAGADALGGGRALSGCFLVEEGHVRVASAGPPGALRDALFPDGCETQDVRIEGGAVVCGPGALLGAPALRRAAGEDVAWRVDEDGAVLAPDDVSLRAGPAGCRGHTFSVATFARHLDARDAAPVTAAADAAAAGPRFSLGDFDVEYLLGEGTYGSVLRARLVADAGDEKRRCVGCAHVAIKQMSKARICRNKQLQHIRDERSLLTTLRHTNLLWLHGAFQDRDSVYLVTECVEGPDLWSLMYEPDEVGYDAGVVRDAPDDVLRFYCATIAEMLVHLHGRGIAYRDLKPENLMIGQNGFLKLVDFGFAKRLPYYTEASEMSERTLSHENSASENASDGDDLHAHFKTYTMCGTAEYIAPEIINGSGHDWSADVWAAGCLYHELLTGATPFVDYPGESDQALIFKRAVTSQYKPFMPPFALAKRRHAAALVNYMLKYDPTDRCVAAQMVDHKYFADVDWPALRDQTAVVAWKPPPRGRDFYRDKLCARPVEPFRGPVDLFDAFR